MTQQLRIGNAVNQALLDSMRADDTVIVLGEDIAGAGGSFGVTRSLLAEFGAQRVIDTPISEAAIANIAVGAAMGGLKPVVEIMFMDFITLAMDALVNQAAKAHFMFGGQASVPMVLRTPHGAGVSAGPQHSQCLEAWFAHIPGLKVVIPSNATDAYHLMRAAINDPNPVIFIEHKAAYGRKFDFDPDAVVEIGKAAVVREGTDITLVSWGNMVHQTLLAADALGEKNLSAEVIDLRTLQPWDKQTVLESLKKTNNLVVVHEAVTEFGPGAEIVATMSDIGFDYLDGPIIRVGAKFTPVPFSPAAEKQYLPSVEQVVAAALRSLS